MKRSDIKEIPEYFEYFLNLNEDVEFLEAFDISMKQINDIDITQLNRIGFKTYEEGKWSVHKILQHIIDWERIWCYRTLIFAREEGTIPEGLDQEIMGKNSNADELSIEQLINELRIVRQSTIMMFESFNKKILETNCKFYKYEMSIFAMGYTITGHQIHHFNLIKEKYIPLDK